MCFSSSSPMPAAARPEYEFVDTAGAIVQPGAKGAIKRLKAPKFQASILGGDMWSGNDGSGADTGNADAPGEGVGY